MLNLNMNEAFEQANESTGGYEPLPASDFPFLITNAEYKQFNSGSWGVNVTLEVTGNGQYDGRKVFDTFILFEADGATEKMSLDKRSGTMKNFGKITYAGLCQAAGLTVDQAANPENLMMKMVVAKLKIQDKYNTPGEKENRVSYYKPLAGSTQSTQAAPAQAQQQQTPQQNAFAGNQQKANPFQR